VLIGTDTDFDHDHWPGDNTRRTPSAASPRPLGDSLPWGLSECPAWNTISDMSYIPAIAVFDDGSRVRPIPIEDEERVAPGDSWLGDRADRQARRRHRVSESLGADLVDTGSVTTAFLPAHGDALVGDGHG
jgi:hypothetical protein